MTDESEFTRVSSEISQKVSAIQSNTRQIKALGQHVGTDRDTEALRSQIHNLSHQTGSLCQEATHLLKERLTPLCSGTINRKRQVQKERFLDQLAKVAGDFQSTQRDLQSKEKDLVNKARANSGLESYFDGTQSYNAEDNDNPFAFNKANDSVQLQDQKAGAQDLELMHEREEQLKQLEKDIVGVNEIFKDLSQMIHEQGDMLDSIEDNVQHAAVDVEQGTTNLRQAVTYRKKARRKKIIIAVVVIIILIIIGVIIYVSVPKS